MVHLHRSSLNGDRVVPGIYPGSSSIMFRKYPLRYDESPEMLGISATNPNVMFPRWILAKQPIVRPRRRAKNASHQRINRSARTERSRSLHAFLVMPGGCRVEKSLSQNIVISLLDNNQRVHNVGQYHAIALWHIIKTLSFYFSFVFHLERHSGSNPISIEFFFFRFFALRRERRRISYFYFLSFIFLFCI